MPLQSADAVVVDQAFYDRILKLMRERGPSYKPLARVLGCDWKTVKRAYTVGWPRRGLPPIRNFLDAEVRESRAVLAAESDAETQTALADRAAHALDAERASKDAVASRVAEVRMVRAARDATTTFLESLRDLTEVATELAKKAKALIATAELDSKEVVGLLREIGTTLRSAMDAGAAVQAMDKKLLGQPDTVVGHVVQFTSIEEMDYEVQMAARAIARLRGKKPLPLDVTPALPPANGTSRDGHGTPA